MEGGDGTGVYGRWGTGDGVRETRGGVGGAGAGVGGRQELGSGGREAG